MSFEGIEHFAQGLHQIVTLLKVYDPDTMYIRACGVSIIKRSHRTVETEMGRVDQDILRASLHAEKLVAKKNPPWSIKLRKPPSTGLLAHRRSFWTAQRAVDGV
jgi:hypothetical protein